MQMATLTSTPELTILLEQARGFDLADDRVPEFAGRARVLAEASDDRDALAQSVWLLGQHHLAKREFDLVLPMLEPLLEAPFALAADLRAEVLLAVVKASDAVEEVNKTLKYGNEALHFFRGQQHPENQALVHACLGNAFTFLCSFHEALEHHMAALRLRQALDDHSGIARSYIDLGWTFNQCDDIPKAEQYLKLALETARTLRIGPLEVRALGNLANVYGNAGDHAKALEYHRQATGIGETLGDFRHVMIGYGNIGYSLVSLGDAAQGMTYYLRALEQLERTPNRAYEGWVHLSMGYAVQTSDPGQARQYLERGLALLEEAGSFEGVASAQQTLSQLYEPFDPVKALEHHKAYAELTIKQLKDMNEKRTQALTVQFEVARLQQERELAQLKNVELAHANERLEELSLRDALTGLYNRRHLDTQLAKLHLEAQGLETPFAVLISDIDDFKQVNDLFSHLIGDEVLKVVAKLFVDQVRALDLVVRYGGEEFVLVLAQVRLEQALMVAEKLRAKVEAYPWYELHPDLRITVSIGLCADTTLEHHERMLAVADDKMYVAKRNGKNQVQA
jgi:diguanylate cyclase (GGDEF)-like protein